MGYTSDEISDMIELPEALEKVWYTRQYYGTLPHNAKAIYQKFWAGTTANPVNLNPLPPSDSAKKWVEYLGSTEAVLLRAKRTTTRASISGWRRSQRSWSLQIHPTRRRATCAPMRWSSWVIRQSPVRGAMRI